jgi:UDPglucose 6-dehydrogenase
LKNKEIAFVITEWKEIKEIDLNKFTALMKDPIIFDGRNCYSLEEVENASIEYHSIGRRSVMSSLNLQTS